MATTSRKLIGTIVLSLSLLSGACATEVPAELFGNGDPDQTCTLYWLSGHELIPVTTEPGGEWTSFVVLFAQFSNFVMNFFPIPVCN